MPELPEIESLRGDLARAITGARVVRAQVLRRDMLHRGDGAPTMPLPAGGVIQALWRHGKQLAVETVQHGCLLVHLGMSGSLRLMPIDLVPHELHVHARWTLQARNGQVLQLRHRDPRRFGWLESHTCMPSLRHACWDRLGPDALTIEAEDLHGRLKHSRRALKAALLDQAITAGLGNIYVDESLFRARLHPCMPAGRLRAEQVHQLARVIRHVLRVAVNRGGSTIQDHRTADGTWGSFQKLHQVYGRAGLPCRACGEALSSRLVQQRMTVFCASCQPRRPRAALGS